MIYYQKCDLGFGSGVSLLTIYLAMLAMLASVRFTALKL